MSDIKCDWRLFNDSSKDCLVCEEYEKCRSDNELYNEDLQYKRSRMTQGIVEDDAKEYAELLHEIDKMNHELLLSDLGIAPQIDVDEEGELIVKKKVSKGYSEMIPMIKFLDVENIPYVFQEPNDLYVSYFLLLSYTNGSITLRLTSMDGVPQDTKFMKQAYKSTVNRRQYKYVKRVDKDSAYLILRSIVFFRKSRETIQ